MKTYTVKPEGINPLKKRMLLFGAAALVIVLASVGTGLPGGMPPLRYGVVALFVVIFGGLGFYRALRRMDETWPSYRLTIADDYILKQQSHYADIGIARDEVKAIWKSSAGEIVVKTGDWKKFIVIPPSLIGLSEVEVLLGQWKPIKPYPRGRTFLSYSAAILIPLALIAFYRGFLRDHTPGLPTVSVAVLVLMVANLFLLRTLRRMPNVDERSRPKRWRFVLTIVYILLFVISIVVFYGLKK